MEKKALLAARRRVVPANLSLAHSSEGGLHIVRGVGARLFDESGRAYLDCVNNVAHVGHTNDAVNRAAREQQDRVNTNTRYLSAGLPAYGQRLLSLFPEPLSDGRCFMVASGSEANDLAMRLCRAHAHDRRKRDAKSMKGAETDDNAATTGMDMFVCMAYGYHGATNSVIDISPYKYRAPGGRGRAAHIIEVDVPDEFDEDKQSRELQKLQESVDRAVFSGHSICGFFCESVLAVLRVAGSLKRAEPKVDEDRILMRALRDFNLPKLVDEDQPIFHEFVGDLFPDLVSCAGQVFLPAAFVQGIYRIVRSAGGLCVADEVQTGFGRLGTWWGFTTLGLVPDIVTMGKSIGNGYPMAAVACTAAVARTFDNGMEYFNSCSGTNTATAVGMAVIDYIEQQSLLSHSSLVGRTFLARLRRLALAHPLLYDVRGAGLFLGIEIRTDSAKLASSQSEVQIGDSLVPLTPDVQERVTLARLPSYLLPICTMDTRAGLSTDTTASPCPLVCGDACGWLCSALVHCTPMGILAGTDGPRHNVLKLKPPIVFSERDLDYFVGGLRACIAALETLHPCIARRETKDSKRAKL